MNVKPVAVDIDTIHRDAHLTLTEARAAYYEQLTEILVNRMTKAVELLGTWHAESATGLLIAEAADVLRGTHEDSVQIDAGDL